MSEPRIIFVTGMKPKPPPGEHKAALLRALTAGLERVRPPAAEWLERHEEQFTLVSWTRLLYSVTRDMRRDLPGLERLLRAPVASPAERRKVDSWRRRFERLWRLVGDSSSWLTERVASPDLRDTLTEVHRYQDDVDGVGVGIRGLVKSALIGAWEDGERVLLIGHSFGSVIAYDSLWELSRDARVDGNVEQFVTLGSPLATRFIRSSLKGADREGPERYPANIRRWANFAARGEIIAVHLKLEPFFRGMLGHGLVAGIDDRVLYNHFHGETGIDPHKSYGYLIHADVAGLVGDWLLR